MYVLADLITAVLFHKLLNGNTKQVVTAVIKGWDCRESYITFLFARRVCHYETVFG